MCQLKWILDFQLQYDLIHFLKLWDLIVGLKAQKIWVWDVKTDHQDRKLKLAKIFNVRHNFPVPFCYPVPFAQKALISADKVAISLISSHLSVSASIPWWVKVIEPSPTFSWGQRRSLPPEVICTPAADYAERAAIDPSTCTLQR